MPKSTLALSTKVSQIMKQRKRSANRTLMKTAKVKTDVNVPDIAPVEADTGSMIATINDETLFAIATAQPDSAYRVFGFDLTYTNSKIGHYEERGIWSRFSTTKKAPNLLIVSRGQ
jgi:hypothetical protein